MYEFILSASKRAKEIEILFDELISSPYITLKDSKTASKLGKYCKELRKDDRKILHISSDCILGENIAFLKVNNYVKPGVVTKKRNRKFIIYEFQDLFFTRF
jgi:hypothetical protein